MAAKPIDPDTRMLVDLARHAQKLLADFIDGPPKSVSEQRKLLAEMEEVVREFRLLLPATFAREPHLRVVGREPMCVICKRVVDASEDSFTMTGAVYHHACFRRTMSID
jgi:hypothetical protein